MDTKEELIKGLKGLTKGTMGISYLLAKVLSVNEVEGSCDVQTLDGLDLFDVRLTTQVPLATSNLLVVPKIDSYVLCAVLPNDTWIVLSYSEIEKVVVTIGTSIFQVDQSGIKIAHGESLKALIGDLIEQIKLITVTTPAGPSTLPLLNAAGFDALKSRFNQVLK